jgi:histidinol dehydrogenase
VTYLLERSSLSTTELATTSWKAFGEVIVVPTLNEAYALADEYAFEHVQIFTQQPREALQKMKNYGALFLGEKTCVSYGDKVCISKIRLLDVVRPC